MDATEVFPEFTRAVMSLDGAPRHFTVFGGRNILHASARETGGSVGIWEAEILPGTATNFHTHTREDESFRILAGRFHFWCGDDEGEGGPGSVVTLPRNVPHRWEFLGEDAGSLLIYVMPGGCEQMFLEIDGSPPIRGTEALIALQQRYGIIGNGF